jgi:hypothetical protein
MLRSRENPEAFVFSILHSRRGILAGLWGCRLPKEPLGVPVLSGQFLSSSNSFLRGRFLSNWGINPRPTENAVSPNSQRFSQLITRIEYLGFHRDDLGFPGFMRTTRIYIHRILSPPSTFGNRFHPPITERRINIQTTDCHPIHFGDDSQLCHGVGSNGLISQVWYGMVSRQKMSGGVSPLWDNNPDRAVFCPRAHHTGTILSLTVCGKVRQYFPNQNDQPGGFNHLLSHFTRALSSTTWSGSTSGSRLNTLLPFFVGTLLAL